MEAIGGWRRKLVHLRLISRWRRLLKTAKEVSLSSCVVLCAVNQPRHELTGPDNMYVYEGEDYSKCSDEDKRGFDQLLAGMYVAAA